MYSLASNTLKPVVSSPASLPAPAIPRARKDEPARALQCVLAGVPEGVVPEFQPERHQHRHVRHPAKCQVDTHLRQAPQLRRQIGVAATDLRRQRLILRGHALDRIGDARLEESQGVVGRYRDRTGCEAGLVQRAVEQHPGMIAGEGPPGAVRAMHTGCKPDDKNTRSRGAERRHRPRPVIRVALAGALKKARKTRTACALRVVDRGGRGSQRDAPQGAGGAARLSWRRCWLRSAISMASSSACS